MPEEAKMLAGKRAFVIGAGSGIGQATAVLFAEQGARVCCADLFAEKAARTVARIAADGGDAYAETVDITRSEQVKDAFRRCSQKLGGIDIAVSTPYGPISMDLMSVTDEQWRAETDVLAKGTLSVIQASVEAMANRGGVVLVATACIFGDYGGFTHPAIFPVYSAAKAAQEALIRVAATLHSKDGIRFVGVEPGFTVTEGAVKTLEDHGMPLEHFLRATSFGMPMGPAQPEDLAEGFLFLASDYASYINGYCLPVDGGSYASRFGRLLPASQ